MRLDAPVARSWDVYFALPAVDEPSTAQVIKRMSEVIAKQSKVEMHGMLVDFVKAAEVLGD